jgi:tight adherence protein B
MTLAQIIGLLFVAALLVVSTIYMWYVAVTTSPKFELRRRLRRIAVDAEDRRFPEDLRVEILKEMTPFDKLLYGIAPLRRLDRLIDRAGVRVDVKAVLLLMGASSAALFFVGLLLKRGMAVPALLAILGFFLPLLVLRYMTKRRVWKFTQQFPDALDMISRSLKAGHSFTAAIQLVGQELADPVAGIFKNAYEEQAMGVSTREAVAHMVERIDSVDLRFFVMAINIHREVGGNLGEILERLAKTIRERLTIRRQVKVYTAQARLSGYILAATPIVMAVFFYFASPGYVEELIDSQTGRYAIALAVAAQVAGFLAIRKIVDIKI